MDSENVSYTKQKYRNCVSNTWHIKTVTAQYFSHMTFLCTQRFSVTMWFLCLSYSRGLCSPLFPKYCFWVYLYVIDGRPISSVPGVATSRYQAAFQRVTCCRSAYEVLRIFRYELIQKIKDLPRVFARCLSLLRGELHWEKSLFLISLNDFFFLN